jgi:hypothetical protein
MLQKTLRRAVCARLTPSGRPAANRICGIPGEPADVVNRGTWSMTASMMRVMAVCPKVPARPQLLEQPASTWTRISCSSTARGKFAPDRRERSSELASDKLYENQRVASTPYPREVLSSPAANGSGLPAGVLAL